MSIVFEFVFLLYFFTYKFISCHICTPYLDIACTIGSPSGGGPDSPSPSDWNLNLNRRCPRCPSRAPTTQGIGPTRDNVSKTTPLLGVICHPFGKT